MTKKPPLRKAMLQVMATDTCSSAEVLQRLQERGWGPTAQDPLGYMEYILFTSGRGPEALVDIVDAGEGFKYRAKGAVPEPPKPTSWAHVLDPAID